MLRLKRIVRECRPEDSVDQILRQAAAPAVAHRHLQAVGQGRRTGGESAGRDVGSHIRVILDQDSAAERKTGNLSTVNPVSAAPGRPAIES